MECVRRCMPICAVRRAREREREIVTAQTLLPPELLDSLDSGERDWNGTYARDRRIIAVIVGPREAFNCRVLPSARDASLLKGSDMQPVRC